jgi:hypothetical protein
MRGVDPHRHARELTALHARVSRVGESKSQVMAAESRPLRGWKEIAAHLDASVRSVRRWEKTRGLPVHRVPSSSGRDTVFARREQLDVWLGSAVGVGFPDDGGVLPHGEDVPGPQPEKASSVTVAAPLNRRGRRVILLVAAGFALLLFSAAWVLMRDRGVGPQASQPLHTLRFNVGNWTTVVGIRDGECGRIDVRPGTPLRICPVADGSELLVAISASGVPGTQAGKNPLTLRLKRESQVRIPDPLPYDLEWVRDTPALPSANRPN